MPLIVINVVVYVPLEWGALTTGFCSYLLLDRPYASYRLGGVREGKCGESAESRLIGGVQKGIDSQEHMHGTIAASLDVVCSMHSPTVCTLRGLVDRTKCRKQNGSQSHIDAHTSFATRRA